VAKGTIRGEMRIPLIWAWRLVLGGFAVAYLLSATLQLWVPPLLPFLAALAVEAQFFLSGAWRRRAPQPATADRGPQARDLAELGWADEDETEPVAPPAVSARPSRALRRLVLAASVLALLAGLFLIDRSRPTWQKLPAHERAATVSLLEQQAARIAGHPAHVVCDVEGRHVGYVQDADGLAVVGGRSLWVTPGVCYRLAKVKSMTASTETATGHAIAVLAHEAWHLHGVRSENCYAYQSGVHVGRALGLGEATARRLMHEQLADNRGDFSDSPAYIVPSGCHRGGSLDLRLNGAHFP
jgi:hypothetical protein